MLTNAPLAVIMVATDREIITVRLIALIIKRNNIEIYRAIG